MKISWLIELSEPIPNAQSPVINLKKYFKYKGTIFTSLGALLVKPWNIVKLSGGEGGGYLLLLLMYSSIGDVHTLSIAGIHFIFF